MVSELQQVAAEMESDALFRLYNRLRRRPAAWRLHDHLETSRDALWCLSEELDNHALDQPPP